MGNLLAVILGRLLGLSLRIVFIVTIIYYTLKYLDTGGM